MRRALGFAVALLVLTAACRPAQPPLEDFGLAPTFNLVDQTGAAFGSDDLKGRVLVLSFIYTHCTDACPVLSGTMAQAQRTLRNEGLLGSRIVLGSLSVDPLHDTPEVLAEYGARYSADPQHWKMLTGDWDTVYGVVADFKVGVRVPRPPSDSPPPGGTEISHTTRIAVVDGRGRIRALLRGTEVAPDEIVSTARRALD